MKVPKNPAKLKEPTSPEGKRTQQLRLKKLRTSARERKRWVYYDEKSGRFFMGSPKKPEDFNTGKQSTEPVIDISIEDDDARYSAEVGKRILVSDGLKEWALGFEQEIQDDVELIRRIQDLEKRAAQGGKLAKRQLAKMAEEIEQRHAKDLAMGKGPRVRITLSEEAQRQLEEGNFLGASSSLTIMDEVFGPRAPAYARKTEEQKNLEEIRDLRVERSKRQEAIRSAIVKTQEHMDEVRAHQQEASVYTGFTMAEVDFLKGILSRVQPKDGRTLSTVESIRAKLLFANEKYRARSDDLAARSEELAKVLMDAQKAHDDITDAIAVHENVFVQKFPESAQKINAQRIPPPDQSSMFS